MANESDKINISLSDMTDEDKKTLFDLIKKYYDNKEDEKYEKWIPGFGDECYFIELDNEVYGSVINEYSDLDSLRKIVEFNNAFKEREAALFESERRKVLCELKNFADEHNDSDINWNNKKEKYFIYYCYSSKELDTSFVYSCKRVGNDIYFTSREVAESAVEHVGKDRILKYIYGIEVNKNEES